ncbi:hypothetical protein O1Q96_24530 [Streptomyces sp. Qhu-G9]|uniref:hypothetical protein n=1 Tax=Streptomyces sp. Qhu-G9 TaxID=3452799 RepID=UPI0022AC5512|nr:hypothetical protein [Streptomyces aurantiacus]WAU82620.1 hypothetical protein O1Q96_24530 [Streptomyces aurantiacus]
MKKLASALGGLVVLSGLLGFTAGSPATAKAVDPNCAVVDGYSDGRYSHVGGTMCITGTGWKHGELDVTCTVKTIGWQNAPKCSVLGRFAVLKDGKPLPKYAADPFCRPGRPCQPGRLFAGSSSTATISLANTFTFSCEGTGNYTFRLTNLSFSMDGKKHRQVSIPGPIEASKQMC